jgi:hypothetical protein
MNFAKSILIALALILKMTAAAPLASAQAEHVRWDIATVICTGPNGTHPCAFNPGGIASFPPRYRAAWSPCASRGAASDTFWLNFSE